MESLKIAFVPVGWRRILLQVWNVRVLTARALHIDKVTKIVVGLDGLLLLFLSHPIINVV